MNQKLTWLLIVIVGAVLFWGTVAAESLSKGQAVKVPAGVKVFKNVRGKVKKWKNKQEFEGKILKVKKTVVLVKGPKGALWVKKSDIKPVKSAAEKPKQNTEVAKSETQPKALPAEKPKNVAPKASLTKTNTNKKVKPIRVAVYDLTGTGLDKKHLALITDSLISEIRKLQNVSAMGMNEIQALLSLEEQRQMLGCSDESCLLEVAAALGADYIILGSIGKIGDESVFTLKRLEMRTGKALYTFSKRYKGGSGEEFLTAIGDAVAKLFPDRPLRPGEKRGVAPEIVSRWNPPPLKPWVFWTGVGLTATSLAAAGAFYGLEWSAAEDYNNPPTTTNDKGEVIVQGSYLADAQQRRDNWALAKWVALGVGGGFAVATGIIAIFTDWKGDVAITPQVNKSGAGIGVQGKF